MGNETAKLHDRKNRNSFSMDFGKQPAAKIRPEQPVKLADLSISGKPE